MAGGPESFLRSLVSDGADPLTRIAETELQGNSGQSDLSPVGRGAVQR